jgi:NADPH:quinone reductase-like Zn-dependent oxidoreductase
VFGVGKGSCAEYVSGPYFVRKPSNLSFEEAAAVPVAAITALQATRDRGKVQPGQSVAINGAGGGVGTFAVQVAKAFGAEVTAVTNSNNIELVRSLGADHVVDYTKDDFTATGAHYDVIIENGGTPSLKACLRALAPGGKLVLVGAGSGRGGPMGRLLAGSLRALVLRQRIIIFISKENNDDLLAIKEMIEAGKLKPVIDRTYDLTDTPDAVGYVETGTARGKVVIRI